MQLEDVNAHVDPASDWPSDSESTHMAEEMQACPQPGHSGSSQGTQAILSSPTTPTISTPSPIHNTLHTTNVLIVHAVLIVQDVRPLQAAAAPLKPKARPKTKPKNVPAAKKAQDVLETPQIGVDDRPTIVDDDFVVIDEVVAGGQPAGRATRSCKGKSRAK